MKKLILLCIPIFIARYSYSQATDLVGVTFGFAAGYSYSLNKTYDYSLTPDANHALKLQPLSQNAFVISAVGTVKLSKIAFDQTNSKFIRQSDVETYNSNLLVGSTTPANDLPFRERFSINFSLDLVNVNSDVSFNKQVSGGIGFGYFLTQNLQVAAFFDVSQIRQMRDYIVSTYQDKPIPNSATTNYNALDTKDNNLFYDKTVNGISVKLIFSFGNKKQAS